MSKIPAFRVGIDGFNLSLEKGTGVATYARTLARALSELGLPVDALFGLDIPNKCDAIMREVHFFDKLATTNHPKTPPIFSKNGSKLVNLIGLPHPQLRYRLQAVSIVVPFQIVSQPLIGLSTQIIYSKNLLVILNELVNLL